MNLITNASDAIGEQLGRVKVSTYVVQLTAGDAPPAVNPAQSERQVLVVDDDPMVHKVVEVALTRLNVRVLRCADGASALRAVDAEPDAVDLVVLGLSMPGMSGAELFAQLAVRAPELPVMIVSGYSEEEVSELQGDQLVGFLRKPFSLNALLTMVRAGLRVSAERAG